MQDFEKFAHRPKKKRKNKPNKAQRTAKKEAHVSSYKQGFDDGFYWGYRAHQLEREEKDAQLLRGVK